MRYVGEYTKGAPKTTIGASFWTKKLYWLVYIFLPQIDRQPSYNTSNMGYSRSGTI